MMILEDSKGNKKTTDYYGFCLVDRVNIPSPKKKISIFEVPGRDGALTEFDGYQDMDLQANFNALDEDFKKRFREFKIALNNADRISFTDDPNYFYKVKYADFDTTENEIKQYGIFTVIFKIEPFIYSYAGTEFIEFKNSDIYVNRGYTALPVIKLTCGKTAEFMINDNRVRFEDVVSPIIIDSTKMIAYKDDINVLEKMTGNFPELTSGENIIKIISGISKFEMQTNERWL